MARPKPKTGSKRIVVALAVVALMVVGYLYYKSRSSSSAAVDNTVPASGNNASSIPASDNSGGASGGPSQTDQSGSDLLAALAGENQQLMSTFLQSEQGLLSLAGSSVGAPQAQAQSLSEPVGSSVPMTAPASSPAMAPASSPTTFNTSSPASSDTGSDGGFVNPPVQTQVEQVAQAVNSPTPVTAQAAATPSGTLNALEYAIATSIVPQSVSGETTLYTPPPLSAQGAAKTGTNPKKTGTLH